MQSAGAAGHGAGQSPNDGPQGQRGADYAGDAGDPAEQVQEVRQVAGGGAAMMQASLVMPDTAMSQAPPVNSVDAVAPEMGARDLSPQWSAEQVAAVAAAGGWQRMVAMARWHRKRTADSTRVRGRVLRQPCSAGRAGGHAW